MNSPKQRSLPASRYVHINPDYDDFMRFTFSYSVIFISNWFRFESRYFKHDQLSSDPQPTSEKREIPAADNAVKTVYSTDAVNRQDLDGTLYRFQVIFILSYFLHVLLFHFHFIWSGGTHSFWNGNWKIPRWPSPRDRRDASVLDYADSIWPTSIATGTTNSASCSSPGTRISGAGKIISNWNLN